MVLSVTHFWWHRDAVPLAGSLSVQIVLPETAWPTFVLLVEGQLGRVAADVHEQE